MKLFILFILFIVGVFGGFDQDVETRRRLLKLLSAGQYPSVEDERSNIPQPNNIPFYKSQFYEHQDVAKLSPDEENHDIPNFENGKSPFPSVANSEENEVSMNKQQINTYEVTEILEDDFPTVDINNQQNDVAFHHDHHHHYHGFGFFPGFHSHYNAGCFPRRRRPRPFPGPPPRPPGPPLPPPSSTTAASIDPRVSTVAFRRSTELPIIDIRLSRNTDDVIYFPEDD